jgi:lysophospholipase L1-like esterase
LKWQWLAVASSLLTCARPGPLPLARAESSSPPIARSPSWAQSAPPAPALSRPPAPTAAAPAACPSGPLETFFDALTELRSGTRHEHVRVLWLGDSHTNADFMSGHVRSALAERFGDGGPGFVRVGSKAYRHEGVKYTRDGRWNLDPDPPARRSRQSDGVFGLGGTRAEPAPDARFSLQVHAPGATASSLARFELCYALPPNASFRVELGSQKLRIDARSPAEVTPSGLAHLTLRAPLGSELVIDAARAAPRLFDVRIEKSETAGVVLDVAGIDGARLETALAWDEAAFAEEVARRDPSLVVVAYGTNEAFDALRVDKYGPQLDSLVQRLRRGAPRASCLVLGPTDAPLGEGSVPRVGEVTAVLRQQAGRLGCSFASLQQLMGGEGSFARGMRARERLAQPDRLHLTPKGYRELGQALSSSLLEAYSAGRADLP